MKRSVLLFVIILSVFYCKVGMSQQFKLNIKQTTITNIAPPDYVKPVNCFQTPSDDPDDWPVDTNFSYRPLLSQPIYIAPSTNLPPEVSYMPSNNNHAIAFHNGRLFFAWRTAETHFASENARMYIISSLDQGQTWDWEWTVELGNDIREPNFLSINGELLFSFFEAGTNPLAFEPQHFQRIKRRSPGHWSGYMPGGIPGQVPWDMKVRGGIAYMTSYQGNHYDLQGYGDVNVHFQYSYNGLDWRNVNPRRPIVYHGGVSEVAFEFDTNGNLWAITRNEDGDESGFGSHLVYAPANDLGNWQFPARSNPERYDSAKMIRHGEDIYIIARRDVGGPYDQGLTWLPFDTQRIVNLVSYSLRPKRTSLYKIHKQNRIVEHLVDLPSAGDTAFISVRRTGLHSFLIANYTSPVQHTDWSWLQGQISPEGTSVYLIELTFVVQ